jgi:hypothetical protein
MRSFWLALALSFAGAAQAQPDPLAGPAPVLAEQPQLECPNCAPAPYWDPYEAEILRLRRERTSRFGPIALMVGGSIAILLGIGVASERKKPSDDDQVAGAGWMLAGATAMSMGAVWHVARKRKREQIEARIVQLTIARASGVPFVGPPIAPRAFQRARRPSLAGPISVTAAGVGVLALGTLTTTIGIVGHFQDHGALIPYGIALQAAGVGLVTWGGSSWKRRNAQRRSYDSLDLSGLPFAIRW